MDEIPMKNLVSMVRTWEVNNSKNVYTQGGKDKRNNDGTPCLNLMGEIVFFHKTIKGTTQRCLPKEYFQSQTRFSKIMLDFSKQ